MQRRWVRRLSPRVLVVALCSVAMVVTAVAVSQADPRSGRAVSVAMLSGGDAASLPGADMAASRLDGRPRSHAGVPAADRAVDDDDRRRSSGGPRHHACRQAEALSHDRAPPSRPSRKCPLSSARLGQLRHGVPAAVRPTGRSPRRGNTGRLQWHRRRTRRPACPPPPPPTCRQYDIRTGTSQPCPPPCSPYDPAGNSSSCPQPCPALATADGKPAPCPPPPCPQPQYDNGVSQPAYACPPPPCAYPTEPDGGTGASQPQLMIYCPPPCSDTPDGAGTSCPPPPPPPCPSAAPTDQSCTPPCSYEPASGGPAAGAFAPCASGVTGRVTAGPTCPVERPDEPCADKPVETTLHLLRKDGSVAATGKSSSDGSFRMIVAPGSYRLVADWPSRIGGCGPVEVTVEYGRFTYTEVSCDTGIR